MHDPSVRFHTQPGTLKRADAREKRVVKYVNPFH
jgi:hypothetical protein